MNHLDEGTIHAWLDGAVDATKAREIEAHVAQCSTCSAEVAEARGLIAGASRILTALDDVPAGVAPKRATAPRRQWRAAPWVTGIAAALVLAIGVRTWNQTDVPAAAKEMASQPESTIASAKLQPTLDTTGAVVADTRVLAANPPANAAESALADAAPRREGATRGARRAMSTDVPAYAGGVNKAGSVGKAIVTPPSVPAASPEAQDARQIKLENVVVTAKEPAAPMAAAAAAAQSEGSETRLRRAMEKSSLERMLPETFAGCYRIATPSSRGVTAGVGAAVERIAVSSGRAPTRAAAPTKADYVVPKPPALVRLDTVPHPLGFAVRDGATDASIGWWRQTTGDSVRVDLMAAGLFTFATQDRVSCPER
jgi:hypothetical protein